MAITEDRLMAVDEGGDTATSVTSMRVRKRNGDLESVDLDLYGGELAVLLGAAPAEEVHLELFEIEDRDQLVEHGPHRRADS